MSDPSPEAQPRLAARLASLGIERYAAPEYRRLLAAARRSLERTGGALAGRISVPDPDDAERKAIIGITGVHVRAGASRMTVPLAALDAATRQGADCGLVELLAALGGPLRDRPADNASLTAARAGLVSLAEASPLHESGTWFREWLRDMRRDGTLTRLAPQPETLRHAVRVLEYLSGRATSAAGPIALPALAAQITGDTKALNHGTALATVVLRALALQAGTARPASAAERRELWDRAGAIVDDLASRVLVLNLVAEGEGLGAWLSSAARYGTPLQVTLHQLTAHQVQVSCPRIYACENPAILRRACAELGPACPPLVCTEGRPSTAFHRLLSLAVRGGGAELWYHGDFDWPGVAITADVIARYAGQPWRMAACDYRMASGSGLPLTGDPVDTPWDAELREAMLGEGRAVYEEMVDDQLIDDLARYRPDD